MKNIYGYFAGLRQPSLALNLTVPLQPTLQLTQIDEWLTQHFGIEQIPDPQTLLRASPADHDPDRSHRAEVATRILLLYNVLMEGAQWPVVTLGRIERLERQSTHTLMQLRVPVVNGFTAARFERLLKTATQMLFSLSKFRPTAEQQQRLFHQLDHDLLNAYRQASPDGRTNSFIASLAHKLGYPIEHLGYGYLQIGHGAYGRVFNRSSTLHDSAMGSKVSSNKLLTSHWLRSAGFPTPQHHMARDVNEALAIAQQLGWPVVVKPADRERSEGVTIHIHNEQALRRAFQEAQKFSSNIMVECQIDGYNHRIFVANGQLVYALKRYPKAITGDGTLTIAQLVTAYNDKQLAKPSWKRQKLAVLDEEALSCLKRDGFTPDTVLANEQRAFLRTIGSDQWGGDRDVVTQSIHPDNVTLAVQVAQFFGLSVCGLDLMSVDITQPWHRNGAIINEVNFKPFFGGNLSNSATHPYLESLVPHQGRIPIHVVMGNGDVWAAARTLAHQLAAHHPEVILTGHDQTENPTTGPIELVAQGLFDRCQIILRRPTAQALVVVVDSLEWTTTGLPFDQFTQLHVIGQTHTEPLQALKRLLEEAVSPAQHPE